VVEALKRSGRIERDFWTGLEVQTVDRRIARYFGLDKIEGVIVSDVQRGSPAERAGFQVNDIIVRANGETVTDDSVLLSLISDLKVGDVIRMRVLREKKEVDLKLRLEKRPS
jgi:serine protease Do